MAQPAVDFKQRFSAGDDRWIGKRALLRGEGRLTASTAAWPGRPVVDLLERAFAAGPALAAAPAPQAAQRSSSSEEWPQGPDYVSGAFTYLSGGFPGESWALRIIRGRARLPSVPWVPRLSGAMGC